MAQKAILEKLSIYIAQKKMAEKPVEQLIKLSEKKDRSINYLVVEAILEYLNRRRRNAARFLAVTDPLVYARTVLRG